jgi:hypothetical protein
MVGVEEARTGSDSAETDGEPVDLASGLSAQAHKTGNKQTNANVPPRKSRTRVRSQRIICETVTPNEMIRVRVGLLRKERLACRRGIVF